MASRARSLPLLSEDTIVAAALEIADCDGLEALSMRSLAKALQCNPMSLYDHVGDKGALLDLMADRSMASLPVLDSAQEWRHEITRFFIAFHDLFVEHPAVAHVMVDRPLTGQTAIRRGERALETLLRAGFDDAQAVGLFIALANYTVGASLYALSRRNATHPMAPKRFDEAAQIEHPTLYRLGKGIERAGDRNEFIASLGHLLDGFAGSLRHPGSD